MKRPLWLVSVLVSVLMATGCSDDGETPTADADMGSDAKAPDGLAPDSGPQVAPEVDPTPVTINEWMVAMAVSPDPMRTALEQGSFSYPQAGWDANKMHWSPRKPGKDGVLGDFPPGAVYAVAKVKLKASDRVIALTEPTNRVWLNGVPYPGDVYGSHRVRVALLPKDGDNLVVLQIAGGRSKGRAELWTTPDELYLNVADSTEPDLVVGDASELCLGVPVLNLTRNAVTDLEAKVLASDLFQETVVRYPGIAGGAVTQLAFALKPKQAPSKAGEEVELALQLSSASLGWIYQRKVKLDTVAAADHHRRTRISNVDRSCQYYGVTPPKNFDPQKKYALVLSLHGAGVQAINQAKSYSPKDWAYVVAATNRRRFGFDWEVWGRLDGIETLDHAMSSFSIDPTRVYLTGHSMGGHGTWHLGVMHPGRFAVIAPSAGWSSFYSYGGDPKPSGVFARTQAHSDTMTYLGNLARRGVYILHGDADTVVPLSEGQKMYQAIQQVTTDVDYHAEPGAAHWWDKDKTKDGVDCVDWDPIFAFMKARTLDPTELDFDFKTPAPWVSARHSFVAVRSQVDSSQDSTISATHTAGSDTVALVTTNVRGMVLDGAALVAKGIKQISVDGKDYVVTGSEMPVGPQDGKRPGVHGPFNELFYSPFCLVHPDGEGPFERYAAFLASSWAVIGNGHACTMPLSQAVASPPPEHNLIFVGVPRSAIPDGSKLPFSWTTSELDVAGKKHSSATLYLVFPHNDRLRGVVTATAGAEHLLFRVQPFTSRLVLPDYMVLNGSGVQEAGLFDSTWK